MRNISLIFLFVLATTTAFAQSDGRKGKKSFALTGKILDGSTGQGMEYATISALNTTDSSMVTGTITKPDGRYFLEVPAGSYFVKAEFIGYQSVIEGPFALSKSTPKIEIGNITLHTKAEMLKEAVVEAERSQVTLSLEKKTFEVGKDLSSIGGTATDVLENVPSVTVDAEGGVSLRGNGNVRILINGKQSGLLGLSGTEALQMFPADQIERVEVITNPSARYDAEGMAGIINIILKEEKKKGTNGVFNASVGWPQNINASANVSHQKGDFTYNLGYSFRNRSFGGFRDEERTLFGDENDTILNQQEDMNRSGNRHGISGGIRYQPNKKNSFILNTNYTTSLGFNESDVDYQSTDRFGELISRSERTNEEIEDEYGLDISLDYTRKFDKKGKEWVTTLNYNQSDEIEDTDMEEFIFDASNNLTRQLLQRSYNQEFQQNAVLQSDFVAPMANKQKLEFGIKSSLRIIETDYEVEEFDDASNSWFLLPGVTNEFIYNEGIHAAYGMYSKEWDQFSLAAGMRFEYSDISTEQLVTEEVNDRDYIDPFPTLHMSYKLDEINSVQLSYSRRIRRPGFWELNPFFNFTNPVSFRSGNPNINPEYTNSMEFSYLAFKEKWNVSASVYYRHSYDVIQWIRTVQDSVTFTRPENVAEQHSYGFEVTGQYTPMEWWKLNSTVNIYGATLDATNVTNGRRVDFLSATVQLSSMMNFKNGYNLQLRGNYQAPQETAQGTREYIAHLDVAITKDLFNGKATVSFKVNDVFNSRIRRTTAAGENFDLYTERQWRPRMFIAGFTYRLNQKKSERGGRGDFDGNDE